MKSIRVIAFLSSILLCSPIALFAQVAKQADVNLTSDNPHFRPGSDLTFKVKLNEALPAGAHFDVRVSPVGINQELPIISGEPTTKERKEFILHTKLPDSAWAGEWHIATVWLFLPGSTWTNSHISTNDMRFYVDGPTKELPTTATAQIVK